MNTVIKPEEKNHVPNAKDYQLSYDEEAAEILRLKEECDQIIHDAFTQIDALLLKIDNVLSRERELCGVECGENLTMDELEVLMHGTQKLEP